MIKTPAFLVLLAFMAGWSSTARAEISGSGSPNSGCFGQISGLLWHDLNANGNVDMAEPGLADVSLYLVYDNGNASVTATTNAAGYYSFSYLCDGNYLAVIDEASVPAGMLLSGSGEEHELGGWPVQVSADATGVFNRAFTGCELSVEAGCSVASLATELYSCEKPVGSLSMIWNGTQDIRVIAHNGKHDDPVLADIDNVAPGDRVTVADMVNAPDDVVWEIFVAGTDNKLGESKFRLACDDAEMDGPEDCGLPQGDGRDNKADRINDWLLDGIVDDSGLMQCGPQQPMAESCEVQSTWADCELIDKVEWLTLVYTGGGCGNSENDQPDDFECAGNVSPSEPVTVLTESGDSFAVQPGESFTIPTSGSDTDIELSNALGTEQLRIKTSCSKPIAAGDIYGSLTLVALNGLGIGGQIDYDYDLVNRGALPVVATAQEVPFRTLHQPVIAIDPFDTRTVAGSAYVATTTTSALLAERSDGVNALCSGGDFVGVIVRPREPCEISGSGLQFHNSEILLDVAAGVNVSATIERMEISWPEQTTDKLKEIKLDGDKIFDQDRRDGQAVIEKADLMGDLHKRRISRGTSKQIKIIFDDNIEDASVDDFSVVVHFKQGCSISY